MNPEEMPQGTEMGPMTEDEKAMEELELINNELIADNADGHLGDEALAEKTRRKEELEKIIAEQSQN